MAPELYTKTLSRLTLKENLTYSAGFSFEQSLLFWLLGLRDHLGHDTCADGLAALCRYPQLEF